MPAILRLERRRPAARRTLLGVVTAVSLLVSGLLSACSSDSNGYSCLTTCTGTIDGAKYSIRVPGKWNGTLLIFSHGFLGADANAAQLSPLDGDTTGSDPISSALLNQGYALAGSSFSQAGWNVGVAPKENEQLYRFFSQKLGTPKRVIAWGQSLGGLITELLAERAPWIDGAAAFCGVVAGPANNADVMTRALILVGKLTGQDLTADASRSNDAANNLIKAVTNTLLSMSTGSDEQKARLVATAALADAPTRSFTVPAAQSPGPAAAAEVLTMLVGGDLPIVDDLAKRFGENVARPDMQGISAIPTASADVIKKLGGDPAQLLADARALSAPATDATSRAKLAASGTPTGRLAVPLVTVHDQYDPIALLPNETVLADTVGLAKQTARLKQIYVKPSTDGNNPYGIGHCVFSVKQWVGSIESADRWSVSRTAPTDATISSTLGPGPDPSIEPGPWPVG